MILAIKVKLDLLERKPSLEDPSIRTMVIPQIGIPQIKVADFVGSVIIKVEKYVM